MSNRIYYAVQAVSLEPAFPTLDTAPVIAETIASGYQSVGINGTVDFEQIFELGRLDIYQNLEGVPSVEVTVERLLPKVSGTASATTKTLWEAVCGNSVTNAAVARPTLNMQVADDSTYSAEGFVQCTGLYISNYTVNFQIDGAMTESMTLVGNALSWTSGAGPTIANGSTGSAFITDADAAGAIIRRQDVTACSPGTTNKLQSVSLSIDFSREDLFELGRKTPYYKAAGFPVESSAEFEYLADKDVSGLTFSDGQTSDATSDQTVSISAGGKTFSIGTSARLNGTNYSGGDAGGGNATITYSYTGYNFFDVSDATP
jgi:hypothetical protein